MTTFASVASATPLLPLDTYRVLLGFNPWHFWGLSHPQFAPVNSQCNTLVYRYAWQNAQAVGRDEIVQALVDAQNLLASRLRFDVAPAYREDTVAWPRLADQAWSRGATIDARGQFLSVQLPRGMVRAIGKETHTLLGTAAVVYTDSDGDGLNDTFSITIAAPGITDTEELGVYVPAAERFDGSALDERWRIAPTRCTLSGGVATITGRAWTAVRPVLYERATPAALNAADATTFLSTLDVARHWADPNGLTVETAQATLLYETAPAPWFCASCAGITGNGTDPAAVGMAVARCGVRHSDDGTVLPALAVYDATSATWSATACWSCAREPDRVLVRYRAGLPLIGGQVDPAWADVLAMLATAQIPGPICACKEANKRVHHWQFDLARTGGSAGEAYGLISGSDLSNPFGTRRGQVLAWKRVQDTRQLTGVQLG